MLTGFFTGEPVHDYASAKRASTTQFAEWFRWMTAKGVMFPPSQFEAAFLSAAHSDEALGFLESAVSDSFVKIE